MNKGLLFVALVYYAFSFFFLWAGAWSVKHFIAGRGWRNCNSRFGMYVVSKNKATIWQKFNMFFMGMFFLGVGIAGIYFATKLLWF